MNDAHDARIAALRARRRARLRVLALRSAFLGIGVFLFAVLALAWLLNTVGGRDLLLRQIVARLPADTTLTWSRAEGPVSGPLTLHDVRFSMPRQRDPDCVPTPQASCAMGTIDFRAALVVLDPAIRPLLGRRLRLDALVLRDAVLDLPRSDKPFELPRWPESLPGIAPPLALQADDIRIDRLAVTQEGAPQVVVRSARGGLDAAEGRLHVERIAIDSDRGRFTLHGDYAPAKHYRSDLVATAVLPAPAGRTPPRLGLVARGDLSHLVVALSGNAPAPVRATLVLDDDRGGEHPRWSLRANSDALDPALLAGDGGTDTPLAFALQADGTAGDMRLQGRYAQGAFAATLQPSHVILADQVLTLQPLAVDLLEGSVRATGRIDLRKTIASRAQASLAQPEIKLAVDARGLRLRGADAGADTPVVEADAVLGIAGTVDAWAAIGHATLAREGQRARLQFDGRGDRVHAAVKRLHAAMPTGTLDASGDLRWSPALDWTADATLAGFDPGYFLPDWKGAVDGRIASSGATQADGGLQVHVDVEHLGGRLRGRALGGHGTLAIRTPGDAAAARGAATAYSGDIALRLGASRLQARGTVADKLDVRADFSPLHLDDLLPDAGGTLRGTLALAGARTAPDLAADLAGDGLHYGDWAAATLRARGRLPWRGSNGTLVLDATGVDVGTGFDRLHADARGSIEHLQLEAEAAGELGSVSLAGGTDRRNGLWQASLARLHLQPVKGDAWSLQAPTSFAQQRGGGWRIARTCLAPAADAADAAGAAGATFCAVGGWPRPGLDVEGRDVPLALVAPWLPERGDKRPWALHGAFALDAHVQPAGNAWRGTLRLASPNGGMRNHQRSRNDLVDYRDFVLDARFDPQRIEATLAAAVNDDGRLQARLATGWDAYAPLSGEIALDTDELTWMELFSPDIVEPTGTLAGHVTLGGTRAAPTLGGNAHLTGFATELPALAIAPHDGDIRLDALPDGTARIAGSLVSGEGTLRVDGTLGWQGDDTPLVLNVRGRNVLASDTRDLHAVVDPDVVVRYAAKQPLQVAGTVTVPEARIDLERLDRGVSVSDDVVVLDPEDPENTSLATPLQLDLTLAMGDNVRLNGFGLDGTLAGKLRVLARPGQEMTGSGALEIGGRYTAYGQKLSITRGQLLWQNGPIDDPMLDIRAEREVGDVTAGIAVTGRASRPKAEVWSDPAMDQSEALAYLTLGRSLATLTSDESRQLDAASAALSAGSGLLASQLGARIGLDDAGVTQSRALGGSVLGVGKYLSPKLYVGYGVSLLGTGQVLTLKYLLRKGFDIEVESSTVENRASVNWRLER